MLLHSSKGYKITTGWLAKKGYKPFYFQQQTWQHIINGESGLVNAPTGTGKTFSVFLGAIIQYINQHPKTYQTKKIADYNYYGSLRCGLWLKTLDVQWRK